MLTLIASIAVAGLAASPASAVKFGQPDSAGAYPWVGLMAAFDEDGNPLWRCTGSLLSEDLFLTAGHCVSDPSAEGGDPVSFVRIWFTESDEIIVTDPQYLENLAEGAEDLCAGVEGYPCDGYSAVGTPEALEGWTGQLTIPQTYDLGLVHITEWAEDAFQPTTYGEVAPVGYLEEATRRRAKATSSSRSWATGFSPSSRSSPRSSSEWWARSAS